MGRTGPPTAVIAGASRGLGLQFCSTLKSRGYRVVALCRSDSGKVELESMEVVYGIDLSRDDSVTALREAMGNLSLDQVDLLVLNAGVLLGSPLSAPDFDAMRQQYEVNALGPLRVVSAMQHLLKAGAKVIWIGSQLGSIASNTGESYPNVCGYRMSKAAAHCAAVCLAHELRPQGVAVAIVHPGVVATDMAQDALTTGGVSATATRISVQESVEGVLQQEQRLDMATTGSFWDYKGKALPW